MIPYIGCETAREMLEAFVDGELVTADQVAVESHLRWCRTCTARVEDMGLIASVLRASSLPPAPEDTRALSAMQAGVLMRVRAEREQSIGVRLRSAFDDMRLFWPAIGASAALAACFFVALAMLQAATAENPESMAALIDRLDRPSTPVLPPANPGSDQNPMRLDGRVNAPRALDGSGIAALESMSEDEVAFAVSATVTREGRIATYDLLQADHANQHRTMRDADEVTAVLDAVKRSRFAPAVAAGGTKVAVNMVWLLVRTTAKGTPARVEVRRAAPPAVEDVVKPEAIEDAPAVVPSTDAEEPPANTA
jgi:anti-sigma factor RsiW